VEDCDPRLGIDEALRAYTVHGAWLTREENIKGTLEAGMLADFVVLPANPLSLPPDELRELEVLETWLGGRRVFKREP